MDATQTKPVAGGLDPFLLPSPTHYRFMLLLALVASVTCFLYLILHNSVPSNWERRMVLSAHCQAIPNPVGPSGIQDAGAGGLLRDRCMAPANRAQGMWILAGLLLLSAVAFALYWTAPARKLKRDRLEPLSADDAPEVVEVLAELCQIAGLRDRPSFVWSPTNAAASGVAFGRRGGYYVALTGGLVARFYTDPPAFRAIVLHELAHLRNRDVDRTYLAVAVWQAFLIVAIAPFVISRFFVPSEHLLPIAWRLLVLTVLVLLTRNEVLRIRELYADLRAAHWEGAQSALPRVLADARDGSRRRWLGALLDFHPSARQRRAILADCTPLFRPDFVLGIVTGATAAIGIRGGAFLFNDLFVVRFGGWFDQLDPGALIACAVMGGLCAYIVGSDLWEAELLAAHRGHGPIGGLRMGAGLGAGLVIGFWVDLTAVRSAALGQSALGAFSWVACATGVCAVVTRSFADAVHAWLALGGRKALLPRARSAGLTTYALLLVLWFTALSFAQYAIVGSADSDSRHMARLDLPDEVAQAAPVLPLLLAAFTLTTGAVPTLTMLVIGLIPFVIRLGVTRRATAGDAVVESGSSLDTTSIRAGTALLVGVAAGFVPLVIGYLQDRVSGVLLAIGATGLSTSLVLSSIAAAAFIARRSRLLGWMQGLTCGLGAGAVSWTALLMLGAFLQTESRPEHQVSLSFNLIAWLALGTGLAVHRRGAAAREIPGESRR